MSTFLRIAIGLVLAARDIVPPMLSVISDNKVEDTSADPFWRKS
jgi:hypothetical protein